MYSYLLLFKTNETAQYVKRTQGGVRGDKVWQIAVSYSIKRPHDKIRRGQPYGADKIQMVSPRKIQWEGLEQKAGSVLLREGE